MLDLVIRQSARVIGEVQQGQFSIRAASVFAAFTFDRNLRGIPTSSADIQAPGYVVERLLEAGHALRLRAEANLGIKSKNVLPMLIAAGVDENAIDLDLIDKLNALGQKRGDVAHKGVRNWPVLPDPKEVRDLALDIVKLLAPFERLMI